MNFLSLTLIVVLSLNGTYFLFILGMQSSSLKLFASFEQKAMLLKRQAFAVFSGELDQYHLYLPLIQGKRHHPTKALIGGWEDLKATLFPFSCESGSPGSRRTSHPSSGACRVSSASTQDARDEIFKNKV